MLEVSEKANEMIKDFMKDRQGPSSVRITMMEGGCSGPSLGMALDEPNEQDEVFNDNGLTFIIEKALWEEARPINIDFVNTPMGSGFKLSSSIVPAAGGCCGSSCGSSCGC